VSERFWGGTSETANQLILNVLEGTRDFVWLYELSRGVWLCKLGEGHGLMYCLLFTVRGLELAKVG